MTLHLFFALINHLRAVLGGPPALSRALPRARFHVSHSTTPPTEEKP